MSRTYYRRLAQIARPADARVVSETYGISAETIAALCGVNIATARRWKRGISRIPVAAKKLLAGDLSAFGREWRGWTIRDGKIVSPEGWAYTPGEVLSLTLLRAQVAHLESLRRREAALVDQDSTARQEPTSTLHKLRRSGR